MNSVRPPTRLLCNLSSPFHPRECLRVEGSGRFLEAITIVLSQICDGGDEWLESTRELQLASFHVGLSCRTFSRVDLTVWPSTPSHLWASEDKIANVAAAPESRTLKTANSTAVLTPFRVRKATWMLPTSSLRHAGVPFASLECLSLGSLNFRSSNVVWPSGLKQLKLAEGFNQKLNGFSWPPALQEIVFRRYFTQPVDNVTWPDSLRKITFGRGFTHSLHNVSWPASLAELVLGEHFCFYQHISKRLIWPASFQRLTIGCYFRSRGRLRSVKTVRLDGIAPRPFSRLRRFPSDASTTFSPSTCRSYACFES